LSTFPAFMKVSGLKVAVFGNGDEAFAKVRLLRNTDAHIVAYASRPGSAYSDFLADNRIETVIAGFSVHQLEDAVLVFAATGNADEDRAIVIAARGMKI